MLRPSSTAIAAVLLPFAIAAPAGAQANPDRDAIAALIERTEAANNAGDVAAWVALFDEDFVYMAPGSPPVSDRAQLIAVAEAGFRHNASISIEPVEIHVLGDWAFARSHVTGQVVLAGSGNLVAVDVKQIVLYRRTATGEWRIARLIGNSNTS